jgi:hypothetical protein
MKKNSLRGMAEFHFSTPYTLEGRDVPLVGTLAAPAQNAMEKINTTHPEAQISPAAAGPYRRASSLLAIKSATFSANDL